jgi:hypothetical protein
MGVWADGSVISVWLENQGNYEGLSGFVLDTVDEYERGHAVLANEGWIFPEDAAS